MTNIEEKELGVKEVWEIVVRRRWWILVPTFLIWTAVFVTSWFVPSQYRSETVILVEQQKVPQQYVVSNVASDMQERLQSMTQQILSRTRLMKIIQDFKLYQNLRNRMSPDELVDKMRDDIKIDLVHAPGDKDLTAFKIYYSSQSPVLAQQVTNELTTLFIDENLRAREQQSQGTTDFLQRQVESARANLEPGAAPCPAAAECADSDGPSESTGRCAECARPGDPAEYVPLFADQPVQAGVQRQQRRRHDR